jgi:hypothetical protein
MYNLTEQIIKKCQKSAITDKLVELLKKISTDEEFILGTIVYAENEEEQQQIIDYIENGEDVSYENIVLFSLYLENKRKGIMQ